MANRCGVGLVVVAACLLPVVVGFWTAGASAEVIKIAKLTASDPTAGDSFGYAVGYDGNRVIVGARADDIGTNVDEGSAYIFEPDNMGGYTQVKKLVPSDAAAGDQVGSAVAISGDLAFVGGYLADVSGSADAGAIWVFSRNQGGANNWGQVAKLTATTLVAGARLGSAMSLDGNTLLVTAQSEKISSLTNAGAAYIFRDNGSGVWSQVARLQASAPASSNYFGQSCGLDGDTLAIGAHQGNKAYVFQETSPGTWIQQKIVTATGSNRMGTGTAIDGDNVSVGAYYTTVNTLTQAGTAYVFGRNTGGTGNWGTDASLAASDPQANGNFGISTAIQGDWLLVGAQGADTSKGAAYLNQRIGGTWTQVQKFSPGVASESFGNRIAMVGYQAAIGASGGEAVYVYAIPEPGTLVLVVAGVFMVLGLRRRSERGK
jgi:hypothetical protein